MSETTIKRIVEIILTPKELALCFSEMKSDQQAEFFSCLAVEIDKWDKPGCFQWAWVVSPDQGLSREGLDLIRDMGEHALAADREEFNS